MARALRRFQASPPILPALRPLALACSALALATATFAAAPEAAPREHPSTVSPGDPDRLVTIGSPTPTFSWTAGRAPVGYELTVYELPAGAAATDEPEPILRRRLPPAATSWTPALEQALAPGDYAWFVRPLGARGVSGPWSEPRLFRVPAEPSAAGPSDPGSVEPTGAQARTETRGEEQAAPGDPSKAGGDSNDETRRRSAGGVGSALSVSGNVNATSFTGDGSMLSNVATDAELAAHATDTGLHTTCDGKVCNGAGFTNVTAVAGDSATGFFSSGQVEEARIDEALARDVEVAAQLGGATMVRLTASGTPAENGAALEAAIAGITDASASKPYTVRLGPGVYDVGTDGATLKPFVNLQGTSVASTIVTGSGDPVFDADQGTIVLVDDVVAERLTVRNTGGFNTGAFGVRGAGARFRLQDARIVIESNEASEAGGFAGVNPPGSFEHFGELVRVDVVVDEGTGIGSPFASLGELQSLVVDDCTITVLGSGAGIREPYFDTLGAVLVVTDTTIRVLGGGVGVSLTRPELQLYRNVIVEVAGGAGPNSGFQGFGSGFKPIVESSRIVVDGTDSAGIRTNNGVVTVHATTITATGSASKGVDADAAGPFGGSFTVRNSSISASFGFWLATASGSHTVRIDHSTLQVSTGFRNSSTSGGVHQIRMGSSKLQASTNVSDATPGSSNPICVASYDENYAALSSTCG